MASAKTETKVRLKTVQEEVKYINLTLSVEEAEALLALTGSVSGSISGPRGLISGGTDDLHTTIGKALGKSWYEVQKGFKLKGTVSMEKAVSVSNYGELTFNSKTVW